MSRIFTPGTFSHDNHGDAALVIAFHALLARRWPDAEFVMTSFSPEKDRGKFDALVLPMVVRPDGLVQRVVGAAARWFRVFAGVQSVLHLLFFAAMAGYLTAWGKLRLVAPQLASALSWKSLRLNAAAISEADAVVMVPGGFFNAYRWTDTFWLYHSPVIYLASAMGKPASLGPCTIGPFAGPSRIAASRVLRKVDRIVLREELSLDVLDSLGISPKRVTVARDVAFQYAEEGLRSTRNGASRSLGVSVRDYNFPGAVSVGAAQQHYVNTVAAAVAGLLELDSQADVVITAQTTEDVNISKRLASMLPAERVRVELDLEDPAELMAHYGQLRLMLGTRMHANILAMCSGTPVLAIGYDPKTRGVLRSLGLEEWVFDIDDLDGLPQSLLTRWASAEQELSLVRSRVAAVTISLKDLAEQLLGHA